MNSNSMEEERGKTWKYILNLIFISIKKKKNIYFFLLIFNNLINRINFLKKVKMNKHFLFNLD